MPSTEMFDGVTEGAEDARADLLNRDPYIVKFGPGIINWMRPGDTIQFPINASPDAEFEQYVTALCKFIGSALGIPYEVLLKNFISSYSASRASLLQFWGRVKVMRQQLIDSFLQPTYSAWMMEAVAKGIINAPRFFEDPRIRRAWTRCAWAGAAQGSIDPLKEIQAAKVRIEMGVSTIERESQELNGSDWRANTIQQAAERRSPTSTVCHTRAPRNRCRRSAAETPVRNRSQNKSRNRNRQKRKRRRNEISAVFESRCPWKTWHRHRIAATDATATEDLTDAELEVAEEIKEEAASTAIMRIYEDIGEDPWSGGGITVKKFAEELDAFGDIRRLNLHINSLGGDVFTGHAIYNIIVDHGAKHKRSVHRRHCRECRDDCCVRRARGRGARKYEAT